MNLNSATIMPQEEMKEVSIIKSITSSNNSFSTSSETFIPKKVSFSLGEKSSSDSNESSPKVSMPLLLTPQGTVPQSLSPSSSSLSSSSSSSSSSSASFLNQNGSDVSARYLLFGPGGQQFYAQREQIDMDDFRLYERSDCCLNLYIFSHIMWCFFGVLLTLALIMGVTSYVYYRFSENWISTNCFIKSIDVNEYNPFCDRHSCFNNTLVTWHVNYYNAMKNDSNFNANISQTFVNTYEAQKDLQTYKVNQTLSCEYNKQNFSQIAWGDTVYPEKEFMKYAAVFFGTISFIILSVLMGFYLTNCKYTRLHSLVFKNSEPVSLP